MNVLFDLDGTLTDPKEGIVTCIRHALAALDEPAPADPRLERFIGPPLRDCFRELLTDNHAEAVEAAVAAYRDRFASQGLFENAVYAGVPEALDSLAQRGARLFVATSKPRVYAERIIEHFGLASRFEAVFGSELDGRLSDKSELIAHAISAARLRPGDTTMVGDRRYDIVGAIRNGVVATGVLWGYGTREELVAAGAARCFAAPEELGALTAPVPAPVGC